MFNPHDKYVGITRNPLYYIDSLTSTASESSNNNESQLTSQVILTMTI